MHTFPDMKAALRATIWLFVASAIVGVPSAMARSITVAWDRNQEPDVAGYIVYVGTEPGVYRDQFDVGNQTVFELPNAADDRWYYFAIAAYAQGPVVGPRSEPVVALPFSAPLEMSSAETRKEAPPATTPDAQDAGGNDVLRACVDSTSGDCYDVTTMVRTTRPIGGLAASADGRLFFVDGGSRVLLLRSGSLVVSLTQDNPARRLSGLALDADFARTGRMYVGEIEVLRDGSEELSIARYREVNGVLGERAVVVPSLPVPVGSAGVFTIDSLGRILVTLPSAGDTGRSGRQAYDGYLLRFNPDGSASGDGGRASPIVARGFDVPGGLVWLTPQRLLLSGRFATAESVIGELDLSMPTRDWPRGLSAVAASIAGTAGAASDRFVVDTAGRLIRLRLTADAGTAAVVVPLADWQFARVSASLGSAVAYVVVSSSVSNEISIARLDSTLSAAP